MYADDLAICAPNVEVLQKCLVLLERYCCEHDLKVNIGKTKIVKFRRGGRLAQSDKVEYAGSKLEFVNRFEYLGI